MTDDDANNTGHQVRRNENASRYELVVDGTVLAVALFHQTEGVIVVPHTEVVSARRGEGLGALLVGGMLDDVRSRRESIVPRCWYVAEFIGENATYADLVAR